MNQEAKFREALEKIVKAWGDYRQHGSDGDTAVECCAKHYDAMDRTTQRGIAAHALLEKP